MCLRESEVSFVFTAIPPLVLSIYLFIYEFNLPLQFKQILDGLQIQKFKSGCKKMINDTKITIRPPML